MTEQKHNWKPSTADLAWADCVESKFWAKNQGFYPLDSVREKCNYWPCVCVCVRVLKSVCSRSRARHEGRPRHPYTSALELKVNKHCVEWMLMRHNYLWFFYRTFLNIHTSRLSSGAWDIHKRWKLLVTGLWTSVDLEHADTCTVYQLQWASLLTFLFSIQDCNFTKWTLILIKEQCKVKNGL